MGANLRLGRSELGREAVRREVRHRLPRGVSSGSSAWVAVLQREQRDQDARDEPRDVEVETSVRRGACIAIVTGRRQRGYLDRSALAREEADEHGKRERRHHHAVWVQAKWSWIPQIEKSGRRSSWKPIVQFQNSLNPAVGQ